MSWTEARAAAVAGMGRNVLGERDRPVDRTARTGRLWSMRILVTGGTGYVGSHMVLALLRDGHSVRLLVRRPEQVAETFGPHGITFAADDVVTGDVLDEASVGSCPRRVRRGRPRRRHLQPRPAQGPGDAQHQRAGDHGGARRRLGPRLRPGGAHLELGRADAARRQRTRPPARRHRPRLQQVQGALRGGRPRVPGRREAGRDGLPGRDLRPVRPVHRLADRALLLGRQRPVPDVVEGRAAGHRRPRQRRRRRQGDGARQGAAPLRRPRHPHDGHGPVLRHREGHRPAPAVPRSCPRSSAC